LLENAEGNLICEAMLEHDEGKSDPMLSVLVGFDAVIIFARLSTFLKPPLYFELFVHSIIFLFQKFDLAIGIVS
jgi:hypothetical protein